MLNYWDDWIIYKVCFILKYLQECFGFNGFLIGIIEDIVKVVELSVDWQQCHHIKSEKNVFFKFKEKMHSCHYPILIATL